MTRRFRISGAAAAAIGLLLSAPASWGVDVAVRELERLQIAQYHSLGWPEPRWPPVDREALRRQADESAQAIASEWHLDAERAAQMRARLRVRADAIASLEPPTRFENPVTYAILRQWQAVVENTMKAHFDKDEVAAISHLTVGTLPAADVNAMYSPVPGSDEHLVLFQAGFFPFANALTRAVVAAMPVYRERNERLPAGEWRVLSTDDREVRRYLAQNEEIPLRFYQAIYAYLTTGRADMIPPFHLDALGPAREAAATVYFDAMGIFAMAHEYGHAVQRALPSPSGGPLRIDWQQEAEADNVGAVVTLLALQSAPSNLPSVLSGTSFLLKSLDFVERGVAILATGQEGIAKLADHPPAAMRRAAIQIRLRSFLQQQQGASFSDKDWSDAAARAAGIERVMDILWEKTRPLLVEAHGRGERPAPIFAH